MKSFRDIRVIPVVLVAIFGLAVLKIAGLVIDGGIYHEHISDTVIKALMDVQLRTEVPVFSAILTSQQFQETQAHFEFFKTHFATKGVEVAEACANTLLSLERLRGQVAAGIVATS